jgi:hypothetical protein
MEVYEGRLANYGWTLSDEGRVIAIQPDGKRVRNHAFAGRNYGFGMCQAFDVVGEMKCKGL